MFFQINGLTSLVIKIRQNLNHDYNHDDGALVRTSGYQAHNSILCAEAHNEAYYATSDDARRRSKPRRVQSCEHFKRVA